VTKPGKGSDRAWISLCRVADNRPLKAEFWEKVNQCIFVSATPGDWEQKSQGRVVAGDSTDWGS